MIVTGKQIAAKARMEADQAKNQLAFIKQQSENQIKFLEQQLAEAKAIAEAEGKDAQLEFQYDKMENDSALALTQMEIDSQKEQNANFEDNKGSIE